MRRLFLAIIFFFIISISNAQVAFQHVSDKQLYSFLDELASIQAINLNTAVKPYSRSHIAKYLLQADENKQLLSPYQLQLLKIYLLEFSHERNILYSNRLSFIGKDSISSVSILPPAFSWNDSDFRLLVRPVFGTRFFSDNSDYFHHSYWGAEAVGYMTANWSVYASLRDNSLKNQILSKPTYFTQEPGGNYKGLTGGGVGAEYSEMRGGVFYSWSWGNFGIAKDHVEWGENLNGSNIFSGRTPSFSMVKLNLNPVRWFEFNYFHGWLVSEVIDSSRSYVTSNGDFRAVFRQKYIAANMFTFQPFKRLYLSVGNSIVYSDMSTHLGYLFPFFFYKSVDHTVNHAIDNQNSQMFLNVSTRQIKHLHVYLSLFIDEFSRTRVFDSTRNNFTGIKPGITITGWPFGFIRFGGEYTMTKPLTYKHRVETLTFESNKFNLGHYLRDNSEETYIFLELSPFRFFKLKSSYTYAWHGNEYKYVFGGISVDELPVLKDKTWEKKEILVEALFPVYSNFSLKVGFLHSVHSGFDVDGLTAQQYLNLFSSPYFHGTKNTYFFGMNYGF